MVVMTFKAEASLYLHMCVCRRNKRDGRFIEKIGFFNPIANSGEEKIKVDIERFEYWTSVGHS